MFEKKAAIKALQAHKHSIELIRTQNDGYLWTSHATDLVKKYIGKGNRLYNDVYGFSFDSEYYTESGKVRATKLMDSCIKFVETNGVHHESSSNFISRMPEGWAIFWAGALITVFGMGGYFIGDYTAKNKVEGWKIASADSIKQLKLEKSLLIKQLTAKPTKQEAFHTKRPNDEQKHRK